MTSRDKEYIETKNIRNGLLEKDSNFRGFYDAFFNEFKVKPLNIYVDILKHKNEGMLTAGKVLGTAPRLHVILDSLKDSRLREKYPYPSLEEKASEIFIEQYPEYNSYDNIIFTIFSSFKSVACEEAFHEVSELQMEESIRKMVDNLWCVKLFNRTIIIFCHDESQLELAKQKESEIRELYFHSIKPYDEFNYLKNNKFIYVKFDSKLNFDNKYGSSWRNYFD
ncbi:hypothetical protein ACJRPK_13395 [Aquimarina sp. 2-A2]|uniref:hypothetical protein n=1 Tax=Aquimarina sp. 2-A2 TaxID=3382644 RepID=UPI00387F1D1F